MQTTASANAKIILSGEHFVVDNVPGIVLPASCFSTRVTLTELHEPKFEVHCTFELDDASDLANKKYEAEALKYLHAGFDVLRLNKNILFSQYRGLHCKIHSSIHPGQGAGSSSALSQAIIDALLHHFDVDPDIQRSISSSFLFWYGRALEMNVRGDVSGIDNAAIAYRRVLYYERAKCISPILLGSSQFFVIGSTGARTLSPYARLGAVRQNPKYYAKLLDLARDNTNQLKRALQTGDSDALGACMNASHEIYRQLDLVPQATTHAIAEALNLGAYGARMTGAGGGGFIVACVPIYAVDKLQEKWISLGLKSVRAITFFV